MDREGNFIEHITTDTAGHGVSMTPLDFGEYILIETEVPEGYELDSTPVQVTVMGSEENNVVTVDILNTKLPEKTSKPEYTVGPEKNNYYRKNRSTNRIRET